GLGGAAAVKLMSSEAKAEALESYMMGQLNASTGAAGQKPKFPKTADIEAQIETRSYRRGVGNLFLTTQPDAKVRSWRPCRRSRLFSTFSRFEWNKPRTTSFKARIAR